MYPNRNKRLPGQSKPPKGKGSKTAPEKDSDSIWTVNRNNNLSAPQTSTAKKEFAQKTNNQLQNTTLQCTIICDHHRKVTVNGICWLASEFPRDRSYIKLYVLNKRGYRKKAKTEVESEEINGKRKYKQHINMQCTDSDSVLVLSVWTKKSGKKPICRVCIQIKQLMKQERYKGKMPLKSCTKNNVKTDDKDYFDPNQEQFMERNEGQNEKNNRVQSDDYFYQERLNQMDAGQNQKDGKFVSTSIGDSNKRSTTLPAVGDSRPHEQLNDLDPPGLVDDGKPKCKFPSRKPPIRGLPNLGNTCFANSVLQVIGKIPSQQRFLQRCQNGSGQMLYDVLVELNKPSSSCVDTCKVRCLIQSVFNRDDYFRIGRQDDSHSFFLSLLESLQDDPDGNNPCRIFEGMMKNQFKYNTCKDVEYSEEQPFRSLLMPIAKQKNLNGCIQDFCGKETFGKNQLECRKCQEEYRTRNDTIATKQTVFTRLPEILVLQMGRFEEYTENQTKRIRKNNTKIKVGSEITLKERDQDIGYDMFGVINHQGSIYGGHYTATVRVGTEWYRCSDSIVSGSVNPERDPSGEPYILFYNRREEVMETTA